MEIMCSHNRKIFSLRIDLILKMLYRPRKQTRNYKRCFALYKRRKHMKVYPFTYGNTVAIIRRRYTVYNIITCVPC